MRNQHKRARHKPELTILNSGLEKRHHFNSSSTSILEKKTNLKWVQKRQGYAGVRPCMTSFSSASLLRLEMRKDKGSFGSLLGGSLGPKTSSLVTITSSFGPHAETIEGKIDWKNVSPTGQGKNEQSITYKILRCCCPWSEDCQLAFYYAPLYSRPFHNDYKLYGGAGSIDPQLFVLRQSRLRFRTPCFNDDCRKLEAARPD